MEELVDMTDNFNEKKIDWRNLIYQTVPWDNLTSRQGWLPFEDWNVIVKIWDYTLQSDKAGFISSCYLNTNESLKEEVMFLTQTSAKQHPNVVNLLGYCNRRYLEAVVYDLNPLDTVHNLVTTGNKVNHVDSTCGSGCYGLLLLCIQGDAKRFSLEEVTNGETDLKPNNQHEKSSSKGNPVLGLVTIVYANNKNKESNTFDKDDHSEYDKNESYKSDGNPSGSSIERHHLYITTYLPTRPNCEKKV